MISADAGENGSALSLFLTGRSILECSWSANRAEKSRCRQQSRNGSVPTRYFLRQFGQVRRSRGSWRNLVFRIRCCPSTPDALKGCRRRTRTDGPEVFTANPVTSWSANDRPFSCRAKLALHRASDRAKGCALTDHRGRRVHQADVRSANDGRGACCEVDIPGIT